MRGRRTRSEEARLTLELHDVPSIGHGDALSAVGPFSAGMPTDDSNLVRKALRLAGL